MRTHGGDGVVARQVATLVTAHPEDLDELVAVVVGEVDGLREARPEARVRRHQLRHLVGVACHDHDDAIAPVLDELDDGVDGLPAEVRLAAADERVRLVDEQDALVGLVERRHHLRSGLAHEPGDEPGAVDLDQMAPVDHAERPVDLGEQPRHGGLARPRVAGEHEMARLVEDREPPLGPQQLDAGEVGDELHLGLDAVEPDQGVELGEDLVDRTGRREFLVVSGVGGGLRGRCARVVGRLLPVDTLGLADAVEDSPAERLDRGEFGRGRQLVEAGDRERDRQRSVVVDAREVGPVSRVGGEQDLEQCRRLVEERLASRDEAGAPHVGGDGVGQ